MLVKLNIHPQRIKVGPHFSPEWNNQFKMDQSLEYKSYNFQAARGKHIKNTSRSRHGKRLSEKNDNSMGNNPKN